MGFKDLKIAKWISKNGFGKKVVDAFGDLSDSGLDQIAARRKLLKQANDVINNMGGDDAAKVEARKVLNSISKNGNDRSFTSVMDMMQKQFDGSEIKGAADFTKNVGYYKGGNYNKMFGPDGIGFMDKVGGYFGDPVGGMGRTRAITTAGAYAGVSVGGRVVSGGSITRNSDGERDIAGIPFI